VARLGGDEFVVLLEDLSKDMEEAAALAKNVSEKILFALNQCYQIENHPRYSTPSIGVTLFIDHHESVEELLKRADMAMYEAKAAGRNTIRFFDQKMQDMLMIRAALEDDLRNSILKEEFQLYYQPQVISSGRLIGVEALLRWKHPQRGMVSPADFIPLAEESGLILPLGRWVLRTACTQIASWANNAEMANLVIAVNVSARQFHQANFVEEVLNILEQTGANPLRLKLELTESMLVNDIEDIIIKMTLLKAHGVCFSLDDFGTGYSSLSYLKRLPLDQLKIDQSFVRNIINDTNDAAIAKMVVALGLSLNLNVIAEGVELEAQRDYLARLGCHAYQGYLFSRPLPLDELEIFCNKQISDAEKQLFSVL
jgi:predicted signal transduction protein with EAL and GGDEF domain